VTDTISYHRHTCGQDNGKDQVIPIEKDLTNYSSYDICAEARTVESAFGEQGSKPQNSRVADRRLLDKTTFISATFLPGNLGTLFAGFR
jgi:hypothetical protein